MSSPFWIQPVLLVAVDSPEHAARADREMMSAVSKYFMYANIAKQGKSGKQNA